MSQKFQNIWRFGINQKRFKRCNPINFPDISYTYYYSITCICIICCAMWNTTTYSFFTIKASIPVVLLKHFNRVCWLTLSTWKSQHSLFYSLSQFISLPCIWNTFANTLIGWLMTFLWHNFVVGHTMLCLALNVQIDMLCSFFSVNICKPLHSNRANVFVAKNAHIGSQHLPAL